MTENRAAASADGATIGYNHTTGSYHTEHDWTGPDTLGETVITSVAAVTKADPLELEPLYEIVDPDALEQLFTRRGSASRAAGDRIELTYGGCDVTVYRDGHIVIRPASA